MSFNPAGSQQIPWTLFGGLNSELEAPTLPEGLSPDCQDVAFVPGNVYTRPATSKIFATSFGGIGVTYQKSFVQPNGDPLNLILTSDGVMHQQDVNNSPTSTTTIFSVVPGVYASSVSQFGREYFAFHDGVFAKDIPRQYDGTNWFRVSQDGPATTGTQLSAADAATTTFTLVNVVPKPEVGINTITLGSGFATVATTATHGLSVGDEILITGNSTFQFNSQWVVASVPNPSSFTFNTALTGLMQGTGGNVVPLEVTATTTAANGLIAGETITIELNSDNNYNNSQGQQATATVGLAGGCVSTFYPNADSNGGAFPWCFGGEGPNLPGTIGSTFTFASNQSLMMNPNTDLGGTNLTGFAITNHGETNGNGMWVPGVTNGSIPPPATTNNGSYVQSGTTAKLYFLDNDNYTSGNPVLSAAFAFGTLSVKFSGYTGSGGPSFLDGQTVVVTAVGTENLSNHDDDYWFIEFQQPSGSYSFVGNPATWSIAFTLIPAAGFQPGTGAWDGTEALWTGFGFGDGSVTASFKKDFAAVTAGVITVSSAGTVNFKVVHKEGVLIGIGGGALYVSGPMNNPRTQTKTALKGYPIVYANNASTEYYHVSIFNQNFAINFPAAGSYPIEIDYAQWHHSRPTFALMWENGMSAFVPIGPGTVSFATPPTWTVKSVLSGTSFTFDAVYAVGTGLGGTLTVGGLIAPGPHQVVVSFLTDTDFVTKPSPPVTWVAAGNKRVTVSGLPIGPPNVKARIVSFTGAGIVGAAAGANFFYLPVPARDPATGQQISTSTVVNDNTSTTATFDFADNSLFEGISIDQTGNDLFGLVTLGPCANIFAYSNRLFVWGDTNKINNLLNMGFEGGTATVGGTTPLGWTVSPGGTLVTGEFGYAWKITGNGANVSMGMITQPAFQDSSFVAVLTEKTQYTFELFAYGSQANMQGSIIAEIYSASLGGVIATATIPANTLDVGLSGGDFVQADFNAMTPATIPPDALIRIYGQNLGNGQYVVLDEMMMVFTAEPVTPGQVRVSYQNNPESFHGVTGIYDIEYPEAVYGQRIIRDNLYTISANHLSRTQDNGTGEPVTWSNYTVSDKAGAFSQRSFDTAEGWGVFASEQGLMMFSGGPVVKVSQEIQTIWDSISPTLRNNLWLKIDPQTKRIYIGVPLTQYAPTDNNFTPLSVNKLLVMDYRELNTAGAVENAPPLHISMTGRMLSSDLTRKWTVWNLPMNAGETLYLPNQEPSMTFASGLGNGLATGYGNVYTLDELLNRAVDDDYGIIGSLNGESTLTFDQWVKAGRNGTWRPQLAYYITYLAPSHEQEQQLQIGSQRKLYIYLEAYVPGVGNLYVVPLLDQIENPTNRPPKPRLMIDEPNYDFEWPMNYRTQRMALMFYATPVGVIPPVVTVDVEPDNASIATFATQQFTATVLGASNLAVTWTTDGGSINGSGLYTAPGVAGTYHVTATSVENPTVSDTVSIVVTGGYG
jgi:hypothetical protein